MDELAMLDREAFAQVWSRVDAQGTGLVEPAPVEAPQPEAAIQGLVRLGQEDVEGPRLQELIRGALSDASVYQGLTRRSRRARQELLELVRHKTRQAKRLSAAYFLMTGVRYWPQETTPVNPPESFFPVLREQFLSEQRQREMLSALAKEAEDPCLQELYLSLAEEAGELVHTIRLIVERET